MMKHKIYLTSTDLEKLSDIVDTSYEGMLNELQKRYPMISIMEGLTYITYLIELFMFKHQYTVYNLTGKVIEEFHIIPVDGEHDEG